jgi:hypothetical protein
MIDRTVTVEDVLAWEPCDDYTHERLLELAAGRERMSVLEILDLDIPPDDRLWVVLRPELIDDEDLHELACRFAEAVLPIWEAKYPEDRRPHAAIAAKRAWLRGEITGAELEAARDAAREAALVAARAKARAVAREAAREALRSAAQSEAWEASPAAARAAAREALRSAAWSAAWSAWAGAESAARSAWSSWSLAASASDSDSDQVAIVRDLLVARATERGNHD